MVGKIAGALFLVVLVATTSLAYNRLTEVATSRVLCPVYDLDGGTLATKVTCGAGGFSSINCFNTGSNSNTVYLGASTVTGASDGFPICEDTNCAGSTISIDTEQGQVYCVSNAASADGGTPIMCLCGQ